jgi:hypothetical protein
MRFHADPLGATDAVREGARNLHRVFIGRHSIARFAFARSRRCALLHPRIRAADGLERAIPEP